jgi:hypothetical protein
MSGIHYLGFIRKRDDLRFEQFDRHWRTIHSELVLAAGLPDRIQGYVQNVRVRDEEAGIVSDFDGAPEIWIRDQAALDDLFASPSFQRAYHEDSPRFVTLPAVSFFVEDRLVRGAPRRPDVLRLIRLVAMPADAARADALRRRWASEATPLGMPDARPDRLVRSAIVSAEAAGTDASAFLGIESSWWPDPIALRRAWQARSAEGWSEQILLARERIQFDGLTESGSRS